LRSRATSASVFGFAETAAEAAPSAAAGVGAGVGAGVDEASWARRTIASVATPFVGFYLLHAL
jgi:hypothetical protein